MQKKKINWKLILDIIIIAVLILLTIYSSQIANEVIKLKKEIKQQELDMQQMNARIYDLELDYAIYEINLQNLEENKDVQFGR